MSSFDCPLCVLVAKDLTRVERMVLIAMYSLVDRAEIRRAFIDGEKVCRRAGIESLPTLSRVTTSLQAKGWLSKKRLGRFGRVRYSLKNPDEENMFHVERVLSGSTKDNFI